MKRVTRLISVQYDYHVARMQQSGRERAERRRSIVKLLWGTGAFTVVVSIFVLWMLFFGADEQRATAMTLLSTALTGLGGAGVLWLVRALFQRLLQETRDK